MFTNSMNAERKDDADVNHHQNGLMPFWAAALVASDLIWSKVTSCQLFCLSLKAESPLSTPQIRLSVG